MKLSILGIIISLIFSCNNKGEQQKYNLNPVADVEETSYKKDQILSEAIDMKTLFNLSPLAVFNHTTDGLNFNEKKELFEKNKSASWEITESKKYSMSLKSVSNDLINLYHLEKDSKTEVLLVAETSNQSTSIMEIWNFVPENKRFQKIKNPFYVNADDFVSIEDKLPSDYQAQFQYQFIEPNKVEVSLNTWMEKVFEQREVINKILFEWDGNEFQKKISNIKS